MENANVLIAEDRQNLRDLARFWLENAGHSVDEAETLHEALEAIEAAASGATACDVVVLDGCLSGTGNGDRIGDARTVLSRIREHNLGVKVIGFSSGEPLRKQGLDVDIDVAKEHFRTLSDRIAEF